MPERKKAPAAQVPDESLRPALEALADRDRELAAAYAACGLPPVRRQAPGFDGLIRMIVGQQLSVHAARAIGERLEAALGTLSPEGFLELGEDDVVKIGLGRAKHRYGRALAEAVLSGTLDLPALAELEDDAAAEQLIKVKGIGRWTADIYLLFALQRPDVWPVDDLAIVVATQRLKAWPQRPTRREMLDIGAPWRPYRSAAARFLWHFYRHEGVALGNG